MYSQLLVPASHRHQSNSRGMASGVGAVGGLVRERMRAEPRSQCWGDVRRLGLGGSMSGAQIVAELTRAPSGGGGAGGSGEVSSAPASALTNRPRSV